MRRVVVVEKKRDVVVAEDKRTMKLERLKGDFSDYRRILGVTSNEFASLIGVDQSFVSRLENGVKTVPDALKKKCENLLTETAKTPKKRGHKTGHNMTEIMTSEKTPQKAYSDLFYERYKEFKRVPYGSKNGDFIQLASLIKRLGELLTLELFDLAITNYFATPQKTYTLADLSVNFDTFKDSAIDRYTKPVTAGQGDSKTRGNDEAFRQAKEDMEKLKEALR